jgi:hypothetical protein
LVAPRMVRLGPRGGAPFMLAGAVIHRAESSGWWGVCGSECRIEQRLERIEELFRQRLPPSRWGTVSRRVAPLADRFWVRVPPVCERRVPRWTNRIRPLP